MLLRLSENRLVGYRKLRGIDQHTIVVIDDVLVDPDLVRDRALGERFETPLDVLYPGQVAHPDWDFTSLHGLLEQIIGRTLAKDEVAFRLSMLAASGKDLLPAQRRPHADGCMAAGVLFLNPPTQCSGGTAFYRHAATGFEWFPDPASEHHLSAARDRGFTLVEVDTALRTISSASPSFIRESTADWELMELVEMKTNRLVLYEGDLFHSAYVADGDFGDVPAARRLTLNIFVQPRPTR